MPSNDPEIRIIPRDDGYHDVAILVRKVSVRRSKDGTEWWIVNHVGRVQQPVICDKLTLLPHFILKLYCKAFKKSWPEVRHRFLMDKLRRKEPSLEYSL